MFVPGKLFKPSLTNTRLLRKFVNYRRKCFFYKIGPWPFPTSVIQHYLIGSVLKLRKKEVFVNTAPECFIYPESLCDDTLYRQYCTPIVQNKKVIVRTLIILMHHLAFMIPHNIQLFFTKYYPRCVLSNLYSVN